MKKKLISALILAVMLICLLPASAFADYDIGDLLRGTYVCHECDNTVRVYLKGFEPEEAGGGVYTHSMYVECVNGHSLSLSFSCFVMPFDDSFVTYDKLSAESSYDPAVYHKAICVCGNSTNKEHNYEKAVGSSRTCSDCGYVQTCDHTPLCEDFDCPVCNETVSGAGHETVMWKDSTYHYAYCLKCYNIIGEDEPHEWDNGALVQEPTCFEQGLYRYTCTVCGETKDDITYGDHDYKDAHDADNHYQECSVCHDKINSEAHKWDDGVITQEPTCMISGIKKFTCTVCGAIDQLDIEGDHDYKDAHDADSHYQECSVCHDKINSEAHKFEWKIDKQATTTAEGEKHEECSVCGYAKESVSIPKLAADAKPRTGDGSAVWFALLIISGSAAAAAAAIAKRRKV